MESRRILTKFKERIKVKARFWVKRPQIDQWSRNKEIFFILAIGRSGTTFLADLLNKANGAYVVHEPLPHEHEAYQKAFHDEKEAERYINDYRQKEIFLRARDRNIHTYGEVNSLLRRHVRILKDVFSNATFLHLVRDGRNVVRSMMSHGTMTVEDQNTRRIKPIKSDSYYSKWSDMSRFEKLCWYWQEENSFLRTNIKRYVKFEKIISDFDYLSQKVLEPLNLDLSKSTWEKLRGNPKNSTTRYSIPHFNKWSRKKKLKFEKICGEEIREYNYNNWGA